MPAAVQATVIACAVAPEVANTSLSVLENADAWAGVMVSKV